jgi:HNH endonuclease
MKITFYQLGITFEDLLTVDSKTYQRFMAKVSLSEHGCWLWTGAKTRDGYGKLEVDGRTVYAHRLAYEHWHEPIGDGLRILHKCDTPECVNPDHLQLGTQADNVADMYAKNRQVILRGEHHGSAKITLAIVYEIRLLSSTLTYRELAQRYSISYAQVGRIVRGERWKLYSPCDNFVTLTAENGELSLGYEVELSAAKSLI